MAGVQGRALTVEEQLIVASDRRWSPLTVGVVAETDGRIDFDRLRSSVRRSLNRHPMARALLTSVPGAAPCWRFPATTGPSGDPVHELDAGTYGPPRAAHGTGPDAGPDGRIWRAVELLSSHPFDLRVAPPVRFLLAHRPAGDVIALVAHHAALDGASALNLLMEVIAGYRADGPAPDLDGTPRPSLVPGAAAAARISDAPGSGRSPRRPSRRGRPAATGHLVPAGRAGARGYGIQRLDIAVPHRPVLADGTRMTVNDLLVAAAHLAADTWNSERGRRTGTVRVRMPMDAALGADCDLGNVAGQAMITTTAAERAGHQLLAGRVVEQTAAAKQTPWRWAGSAAMAGMSTAMTLLPGPVRPAMLRGAVTAARPFLSPSLAVSNIGRFDQLPALGGGGPVVTRVTFTGTTGMPQGLLLCAAGNRDRLILAFCHHRRLFDQAGVRRFVELYQDALADLASIPPPAPA